MEDRLDHTTDTIGEQWNNVAEDSTRARLEKTYGRVDLAWKRPDWPDITLTYAHNSLNSTLEPRGIAPQRSHNHTLETALTLYRHGLECSSRIELYPRERSPSRRSGDHREDADAHGGL